MEILILLALSLFFNIIFFLKFDDISKIFNIIDKPDGKLKRHKEKVSLLGGFIIISNLYLIIFLCYFLDIQNLIFEENFIYIILILSSVFFFNWNN